MKVAVHYLGQMRQVARVGEQQVELPAGTLRDLIEHLAAFHGPSFRALVLDPAGTLRPTVLYFVGETQVLPGTNVELQAGDTITLLTPMAGG